MAMDRQGSILSNLSDFDILDVMQDDEVDNRNVNVDTRTHVTDTDAHTHTDSKAKGKGDCKKGASNDFLHKNREIFVKISVRESHGIATDVLSSTRLYDIECTHSGYKWQIVRKYGQFEELHRALSFYRASLVISRTATSKATVVTLPSKDNDNRQGSTAVRRKMGRVTKVSLRFPKKPEIFISSAAQVERRRRRLQEYLNAVLKDETYRTHEATMRFLEVSKLSFAKNRGEKFHEGFISKRSGGRRFATVLSCFAPSASIWNKRWLVLKDSYICYLRGNQEIADVMLFDQDFYEVKRGLTRTRIKHGLVITNTVRELALKTTSYHKTRNWVTAIEQVAESCEYVHTAPNNSFAPQRKELAHWYVDAISYFADIASALESAQEEIFITDWWLSPELFLRRPVVHMTDPSRLDKILLKKAEQGVKIYILLYKEIEMVVGGIQSFKSRTYLESLHPNIMVMRHPDHIKSLVYMWTHHEKIVCVDQTIAFLGGLDLCYGRWDDCQHRLTDVGSVQSVTPPVSRPLSTYSTTAEDWKGIGSADLKLKGSKKKLNVQNGFPVESHSMFLLGEASPKRTRKPSPRSHSASDFVELKKKDHTSVHKTISAKDFDIKGAKPARKFRLGAAGGVYSHSTTVLQDSDMGQETDVAQEDAAVDSLFKTKLHVSDEDVFVSVNQGVADLRYNNNIQTTLLPLPRLGSDLVIDSPNQDLGQPTSTTATSALLNLPFNDQTTPFSENYFYEGSQITSITSANCALPFASTKPTDVADCAFSTGFGDFASVERLDYPSEANTSEKQDGAAEHKSMPLLSLEPIRDFCRDVDDVHRKKSWGKTPNPPAKHALLIPQLERAGKDTTSPKKTESRETRKQSREMRKESREMKKELKERRKESRHTRESVSEPRDESTGRKSWKKMRNSMDKIKRVLKHEQSQFVTTSSRKSSSASLQRDTDNSTKFWLGKDYVNWIYKDLDSADAPYNDLVDRLSTVRMPWHDIGCVVFNKAATDVGRHFIQRWNHAKKVKASSKQSSKYPLLLPRSTNTSYKRLPPFIKDQCELVNCQILRSCSGWSSGMQRAEHSIYNAYIELIEHAEHYIYIENQFFISWCGTEVQNCICEALVNRIVKAHEAQQIFRVYLVLPLLPAFEGDLDPQKTRGSALYSVLHWIQQSLVGHENSLFKKLYSYGLDPNRYVSVCGLRKHGSLQSKPVSELIYVHSKLMIVDDRRCIIGSANINDRSLSGERDSEIAVLVEDELFLDSKMSDCPYQAGKFCYSLRNNLFQEHLGLRENEFIQDVTCEQFYKNTWVTTAAVNTSIFQKVFNCLPCDLVPSFQELRAYRTLTPLATSDPVGAKQQLSKVKGHLVMYPLQFLKDEILINHLGAKENLVPNRFWT